MSINEIPVDKRHKLNNVWIYEGAILSKQNIKGLDEHTEYFGYEILSENGVKKGDLFVVTNGELQGCVMTYVSDFGGYESVFKFADQAFVIDSDDVLKLKIDFQAKV